MRRRRTDSTSPTGNLDSLLDTMTNVVGILIIVIIVSQINVSQAVKRIRDGLEPVSEKQLAALQAERDTVAGQLAELVAASDAPVSPQDVRELEGRVAALRVRTTEARQAREEASELVDLYEQRRDELGELVSLVKTEREAVLGLDEQVAGLRLQKLPAKRVRLPNPRDPYEDAEEVLFLCAGERVILIDYPGLLEETVAAIEAAPSLVAEKKGKTLFYDQEKTKRHIEGKNITRDGVRASVVTFPTRPYGQLLLTPDLEGGGQAIGEALEVNSALRTKFNRARSDRNYVRFLVHPDAFETYLVARRLAEEIYLPVGWEPTTAKELRRPLPGVRFKHDPPPPPDPDKPAPPKRPPPPKPPVLD